MKTKILVGLITILLACTIVPMQAVEATPTTLHSGINLKGYHWICLESDDWGADQINNVANISEYNYYLSQGASAGFWSQMTLESITDLDDLYAVLARHPGVVMTSNFVMEFMNGSAMQANGFTQYVGIPINKTGWINETKYGASTPNYRGDLNTKWLEGYQRGLWLPEYHGRTHTDTAWLLQNCSEGCATTINFVVNNQTFPPKILTGSDYENNPLRTVELGECNKSTEDIQENLTVGVQEFYNTFGYWPETTVAANYLISNNGFDAIKNSTIYGVTCGPGYRYDPITGVLKNWGYTDFQIINGVSLLTLRGIDPDYRRNISFLSTIMGYVNGSFAAGNCVQMNFHKHNFQHEISDNLPPGSGQGPGVVNGVFNFLDAFISAIETSYPDVWFLTSPELAQLNLRGYSIQNWTDKIVVRNALSQRSITVHIPSHFDIRYLSVKDSNGHARSYISNEAGRTISITVPHNETFTIKQGSIPAIRHFMTDDAPYFTDLIPFFMLIVIIFTACVAIFAFFRRGG